ncbi:hypothetical protein BDW69DRAFT_157326 [Aspergillus filifer]
MSPRPPNKPDDRGYELSPTPARTKEENQERAFTAASRRKDRTLDARVESANRASALHKKRTGRALMITRAIVAAEGMYEEIDENYDAKIQRYRKVQDAQINSDFDNSLLAGLTGASHSLQMPTLSHNLQLPGSSQGQMSSPSYSLQTPQSLASHMPSPQGSSGPEADSRRASTLMPNRPTNPRHLSLGDLHLSQLQISSGPKSDPLPGAPNFNVIPTPGFSPSYTGPDNLVSSVPPYPMRSTARGTCPGFNPSAFDPTTTTTYMGGLPTSNAQNQYRNRIASVPNVSFRQPRVQVHSRGHSQATTPAPAATSDGPTTHHHNRVRSEPGSIAVPLAMPTDTDTLVSSLPTGPRRTSTNSSSTTTTDLLPTPRTTPPHTPTIKSSCQAQGLPADMNMSDLNSAPTFNYGYNLNLNLSFSMTPNSSGNTPTSTSTSTPTPFKYTPAEMAEVGLQISPTTMTDEEFDDFRQFASGLDGNAHFLPMQSFDPSGSGSGGLDFGVGFDNGVGNGGAGAEVC